MTSPDKSSRFDLSTPDGRKRAERDLIWGDHGFLRARFSNFHWIEEGVMARANQPSPKQIAHYAAMGIKTILNLRGPSDTGYYWLEREACEKHGLAMIDFRMFSREAPSPEQVKAAKALFEQIEYPALMHCKSGADRAGAMAVLYKILKMGVPVAEAIEQLEIKYLHVKHGKTGVIDYFFERYLAEANGRSFEEWAATTDPKAIKKAFSRKLSANIPLDALLQRE
ncbi:MAG: tyrosine-protein phosphatase [Hyphomonadaceae bacterium]|jgi:protein tyrosine/serine phosphatase|nr:tyrosine-protein phosphatase [Hyphomonadaceae bacterium]